MTAERGTHIRPSGRASLKIFAATAAFAAVGALGLTAGASAEPPPPGGVIKAAGLKQEGKGLILQVRTGEVVNLSKLERQPDLDRPRARYLCFELTRAGSRIISRVCLGGRKNSHHRVGVTRTNRMNEVYSKDTIAARVKRVNGRKLVVTLDPSEARLRPASYSWRTVGSDGTCGPDESGCRTSFPKRHLAKYDIVPVAVVGCTGGDGEFVTHGPRGRKRIALTFDDGPSLYTADVLHILKRYGVKSTFFEIGQEVQRYPQESRRILALGHELANHTTHHGALPGYEDIHTTNSIIDHATGFRPCLFRPPGGAVSSSVFGAAAEAKVKVVNWDIDTNDWKLPGSGSILSSIRHARSGSIVLMHDGGGPRSQTVEALTSGIKSLQHRGYELVTVTELLGNEFIYKPVR